MGSGGGIWETSDVITAARMNQKTVLIAAVEPGTMYAGMIWFDSDDSMGYQRNTANDGWHTLTKEELAHTITGLWTFNRGAAAPFAVDAASLVVANLDADQVDGFDASSFPRIRDTQKNQLLTGTGETEIVAYTVDGTNRIMKVAVFFRVITATTVVTVKIYYTNVASQSITATLVDAKSLGVNDYTYAPMIFEIKASTEISLKITAGTANQVYASGMIEEIA